MNSLFDPKELHLAEAAMMAGLEANGQPDGSGDDTLMSVKLLLCENKDQMAKQQFDVLKLVFPKKDAKSIAAQLLAAAEGKVIPRPPQVVH